MQIATSAETFINGVDYSYDTRRFSNGQLIMETSGHDGVTAWEAAGAGKRGKKVRRVSVAFPPRTYGDCADINHNFKVAVAACTTIEQVQAAAEVARARFVAEQCAGKGDGFGYYSASYVEVKRGIDVPSCDQVELAWGNDGFSIVFSPQRFMVSDKRDMHNEPRLIPSGDKQSVSARRAYELLNKTGQEAVEKLTFSQLWTLLSENGVRCHYYCALD